MGRSKNPGKVGGHRAIPRSRLDAIEAALGRVLPHSIIERKFATEWKITRRQVRRYISKVYEEWEEQAKENRATHRSALRWAFQDIYQKSYSDQEWGMALQALDRIGRLDGCYAPDKVEVSGEITNLGFKDAEEAKARLVELMKKHREKLG